MDGDSSTIWKKINLVVQQKKKRFKTFQKKIVVDQNTTKHGQQRREGCSKTDLNSQHCWVL